jgi:hypothetical protein
MEYVTSFNTVYKTAAANLIFKSREEDWRRVLHTSRVYISSTMVGDDVANEIEIAVSSSDSFILRFAVRQLYVTGLQSGLSHDVLSSGLNAFSGISIY